MEFVKVLVSIKNEGIKEMEISSKNTLIDAEVYLLASKMFPHWIGFDEDTGYVILKDRVESFSMYKYI